jgi:hypothetical protein
MNPEKLAATVNQSGFPLQIGIENLVKHTHAEHGWRVLYTEHAWKNADDGDEGFLDLVLEDRHGTSLAAIECKRVLETSWIFLQPGDRITPKATSRAWLTLKGAGGYRHFNWFDINVYPDSPQSAYCVVRGHDEKSRPMLERVASELISATEALAREDQVLRPELGIYFSIIVTTARLHVCMFDPNKIDVETGHIPDDALFHDVPYVRFRKQLSARAPDFALGIPPSFGAQYVAKAKEHTVFVVNSSALLDFLTRFEVDNDSFRRFM